MKRLEAGDKVVLNKSSRWVEVQVRDGYWCSLKGVLTVTDVSGAGNIKVGRNCLHLERTSFAVVNNEEL